MFEVGLIVLGEVIVYIRREIGAGGGLGARGRMVGDDTRLFAPAQRVNSRITETQSLRRHTSTEVPPASKNDRAAAEKKQPVQRKAFARKDSEQFPSAISKAKRLPEELLSKPWQSLLCSRAFVP